MYLGYNLVILFSLFQLLLTLNSYHLDDLEYNCNMWKEWDKQELLVLRLATFLTYHLS